MICSMPAIHAFWLVAVEEADATTWSLTGELTL